ncbi:SRPBCC family protein [Tropicibacter sp. Alg240-R139]|uniref:SRPBCC family protein n=1 Tax=Tropicibacter sp. Alg240-R139 TaxID=2305991 RepID=UPI0013DFF3C6|nr:SRPBCC family protein [Tropicibacter sp. Alg240-R139]
MHVYRSMILDAPIDAVWSAVRAFDGVSQWNPGVTSARMETGTATSVGSIRHLDIVDGTVFRETLLELSDVDHFYTYDIIDSPLPVQNYVSTHRFIPITHTNQTLGIWESRFDCAKDLEQGMGAIVGDGIYVGAMTGLDAHLTGGDNG